MSPALDLLKNARKSLLIARTDQALALLEDFERLALAGKLKKSDLSEYGETLREVRMLAEAAQEGVAAAQREIAEITAISRNLDTYDISGRRVGTSTSGGRTQKF